MQFYRYTIYVGFEWGHGHKSKFKDLGWIVVKVVGATSSEELLHLVR